MFSRKKWIPNYTNVSQFHEILYSVVLGAQNWKNSLFDQYNICFLFQVRNIGEIEISKLTDLYSKQEVHEK